MKNNSTQGTTLVEILIACAVLGSAVAMIFGALEVVTVLWAKNGAINLPQQRTNKMTSRIVGELRGACSVPQLINSSFEPVPAGESAEGVRFQGYVRGPNKIFNPCNANSKNIRITRKADDPDPKPGMRLVIPAFGIEAEIEKATGVNGQAQVQDIQLKHPLGKSIECRAGTPIYAVYITQSTAFLAQGGELRQYSNGQAGGYVVVARGVAAVRPFSYLNEDKRRVRVAMRVRDESFDKRGFNATDFGLGLMVPYRCRLTHQQ